MSSVFFLQNHTASPLPRSFNLEFGSLSLHKKTHNLDDRGGDRPAKRLKIAPTAPRPRVPVSSMIHGHRRRHGLPSPHEILLDTKGVVLDLNGVGRGGRSMNK
ncbi:hypothetical protein FB45DRAFT_874769 [Roridomyces roridus]|uniref:Uncharacterized protein n=1 Tax=Roridomyces roridus TaxID=1738132 RepID=A0AAD7B6W1_9AGAR|nr:hypothetical protein FB45DRAFT_874769 [Roridomyces roridus]